jgi:hypothetical protein
MRDGLDLEFSLDPRWTGSETGSGDRIDEPSGRSGVADFRRLGDSDGLTENKIPDFTLVT